MMVLAECIDFDILLLCHRTFKLYSGKPISEIPISTNVLENVTNKIDLRSFHDGPLLAKQLLVSLKNINGLLIVPSNTAVAEAHNALNQKFLLLSTRLMEKFADILPGQLSKILADEDASQGFGPAYSPLINTCIKQLLIFYTIHLTLRVDWKVS